MGGIWQIHKREKFVGPLLNHFMDNIMADAIRLRVTIGRTMLKYPNLSWHLLEKIIPQEFINYKAAIVAVGGNAYYGYSESLDLVKAANFRNLGYLAKELLVKLNNEGHLNYNKVFEKGPDKARIIDKVVARYILETEQQGDIEVLGTDKKPIAMICETLQGAAKEIQDHLVLNPACFL